MKNITITIASFVLFALFVLSISAWGQDVKYRCPNGCEGATFSYMHSSSTLMYWTQWTIDKYGNKKYGRNPNTITNYYKCNKCNKKFKETELIATAKAYNDSVANALPDTIFMRLDPESNNIRDSLNVLKGIPDTEFEIACIHIDTIKASPPLYWYTIEAVDSLFNSLEKRIEELEEFLGGRWRIKDKRKWYVKP